MTEDYIGSNHSRSGVGLIEPNYNRDMGSTFCFVIGGHIGLIHVQNDVQNDDKSD